MGSASPTFLSVTVHPVHCTTAFNEAPHSCPLQVVVKVLKPGVEDTLTADLSFVYLCSRCVGARVCVRWQWR